METGFGRAWLTSIAGSCSPSSSRDRSPDGRNYIWRQSNAVSNKCQDILITQMIETKFDQYTNICWLKDQKKHYEFPMVTWCHLTHGVKISSNSEPPAKENAKAGLAWSEMPQFHPTPAFVHVFLHPLCAMGKLQQESLQNSFQECL